MNQGKLEVVKQEMARVNINVLGINELTWTGMDEFNTDDHHIYYCGQEPLQFSSVAQSCPTLCNPINCSMPGLPVHHQLPLRNKTKVQLSPLLFNIVLEILATVSDKINK